MIFESFEILLGPNLYVAVKLKIPFLCKLFDPFCCQLTQKNPKISDLFHLVVNHFGSEDFFYAMLEHPLHKKLSNPLDDKIYEIILIEIYKKYFF